MDRERKREEIERLSRVQKIYGHPLFQECLAKNRAAEETRSFCKHDMTHFLDVARLAYIFTLERGYGIAKEEIYAAALLHDVGKWRQYTENVPHEQAGAAFAEVILKDTGFTEAERERILAAILAHRGKKEPHSGMACTDTGVEEERRSGEAGQAPERKEELAEVLYDADKISRACYACPAGKACNWDDEKKNLGITW